MKELELYIHIPFCVKKCHYCDFLSAPASESVRQAYVRQLQREIRAVCQAYKDRRVTSVFVGGGTPSILTALQMQSLLGQLNDSFCILPDAEITVECNPGTVDAAKMKAYRESGVNRLSIGLQSANAQELRLLGRAHTFGQFVANYGLAREIGFKNINIDIIFAVPGQKVSDYEQTLQKVLALRPEHISAYSLMVEEGTPFFVQYGQADAMRGKGKEQHLLPSEEEERQMDILTRELLKSAGYCRYEISNYALDGFACQHNMGYWLREDYLGLGLGAASLVDNTRFSNTEDFKRYLEMDFTGPFDAISGQERLSMQGQMEEFMFLGLRMMRGVSAEKFKRKFLRTMEEVYGTVLDKQLKEGLIKKTKDGYCLTEYGIDVSNYVMAAYLLDDAGILL